MGFHPALLCVFVIMSCSLIVEARNPRQSLCDSQTAVSTVSDGNHTIPRHCRRGRMTWHYPQGNMILHFHPFNPHNRTIWVCVQNDIAEVGMAVSDMTRRSERELPDIGDGFAICVPTVDDRLDLKWVALQEMRYMAALRYTVVKTPR
ncbi:uncharacterized protein LOC132558075 [Ylistrum balloti]|uniref:uncharacterized protein LOC132558075 n=1 Tax=Ylistrum balloti TaxID=509963 RepID=UPI00290598B0|nr:uncharacterized protein LOC132558075 [Ylistrum balloti]